MHQPIRTEIKSLITEIQPFDDLEKAHIKDTIEWIDSGTEIFRIEKPATPPKHLVSYTVFVDPKAGKVLLLEHRKALRLLPGGGHVDKDESPYDSAFREVEEEMNETGKLLFDSKSPFFLTQWDTVGLTVGHTDVSLWYVFERDCEKPINDQTDEFKREFSGYKWLTFEEILKTNIDKLDGNMHRFTNKLILKLNSL